MMTLLLQTVGIMKHLTAPDLEQGMPGAAPQNPSIVEEHEGSVLNPSTTNKLVVQ